MPDASEDADLRGATRDAWEAVQRIRAGLSDRPAGGGLLGVLAERVSALLGEFAWEIGLLDPAEAPPGARLDHVGLVVHDLRAAATLYGGLLGGALRSGGTHRGMGVRSLHFTYPGGGKVELLQPVAPGPVADFLDARGGGPHHLTFFAPSLDDAETAFARHGIEVIGADRTAPEWQEVYLAPRTTQGCLIQVVQGPEPPAADAVTVESVLADEWEWVDHRPRRASTQVR